MTIHRSQSEMFDAPLSEVLKTLRAVLANGQPSYRYDQTIESDGGREFKTTIHPYQAGMTSTKIQINLYAFESKAKIRVEITSPWYVWGDNLDFYGSYIRELIGSVRSGIGHEITPITPAVQEQSQAPMKLYMIVTFTFILLLISYRYIIRFFWEDLKPGETHPSVDKLIFQSKIQAAISFCLILGMIGFNYWWRKKYFSSLDPKIQMSMDYGQKSGRKISIVMGVVLVFFLVYQFLLKNH